jgi:hypothetical protein
MAPSSSPPDPGPALAADWLSLASGLGGPSMADSLKAWAAAEMRQRLELPIRRHPWLAVSGAALAGALLSRARWPRPLLMALASQVLLPRLVQALSTPAGARSSGD